MKSYLITDPLYYGNDPEIFSKRLTTALRKNRIDIACFRDKVTPDKEELMIAFLETIKAKSPDTKAFINGDLESAIKLGAAGVHLNSLQRGLIKQCADSSLLCAFSAHSFEDIEFAQSAGASFVTFSPIFNSPGKGKPLGLDLLKRAVSSFCIPIFALGGIDRESRVRAVGACGVEGFASIRYFAKSLHTINDTI